jgi:hypothetical protein
MAHRKPPQGTTHIRNFVKEENLIEYGATSLVAAVAAEVDDTEFAELAEAKRSRNYKELARLIPILRERYGVKDFERMFKAI